MRIFVAITGASGALYGVRLLQRLHGSGVAEVHAALSHAGERTLRHELDLTPDDLRPHAHVWHGIDDIGAAPASGSARFAAMAITPCSMRTLAAIACGLADNLVTRAADVMLKERRRLLLAPREPPLHALHLRHMLTLTEMGAIVSPPMPALYWRVRTVEELVDRTVDRWLDLLDAADTDVQRWNPQDARA